jgi:predicted dienelactone hydrolase
VEIVSGDADENVPVASGAKYLSEHIPGAKLTLFPGGVGHYVFLPTWTKQGRATLARLCTDRPGVDRESVHAKTSRMALSFLAANLK